MIFIILSLILFIVFTLLGSLHFYWFFGGIWGLEKVIPSSGDKASSITIPKFATLFVALGLVSFGLFYFLKAGLITVQLPEWVSNYGYWIIPSIFILRAIGEFKYVGFFKKIKNTEFAKADTKLFSPLCLGIGIIGILLQVL